MHKAVTVENLMKHYHDHEVLKGISFTVENGEIFALLGVNGAGKTTTLECLEGLRQYDAGTLIINGTMGVQLQSSSIPKNMKVQEVLTLFAKWNNVDVRTADIDKLGITAYMKKRYGSLSTGMKRRVHLVLALLNDPDILLLDEPTAGLDVEGRAAIHDIIRELKDRGKTIILASHDMSEVESLCDRVIILKDGGIAFQGSSEALAHSREHSHVLHVQLSRELECHDIIHAQRHEIKGNEYIFHTNHLEDTISELLKLCYKDDIHIEDIHTENISMEQIFLKIAREDI